MTASDQITKVASQIAHDLCSPLASIQAVVKHCKETGSIGKDFLNLLELSCRRLQGIANDLMENGSQAKNKKVFSLHEVLDDLLEEYSTCLGHKIEFRKVYGDSVLCLGDPERIQRAFDNVLKNAVEAIGNRGVITLSTGVKEGNCAVVEITDTGCGMALEDLSLVLEGDGYTKGKKEGHGIGMGVVREVMEEHGGALEGTSGIGKGTTFRLSLPLTTLM